MKFNGNNLLKFQADVMATVPEKFRLPRVFTALALVEELGEVIDELNKIGNRVKNHAGIRAELGDIAFSCAEIANEYRFELAYDTTCRHDSQGCNHIISICSCIGHVSRSILEIECFNENSIDNLFRSISRTITYTAYLSHKEGHLFDEILNESVNKMLERIKSGKWESKYAGILLEKRIKHN